MTRERIGMGRGTNPSQLIMGYAYHQGGWRKRKARNFGKLFATAVAR